MTTPSFRQILRTNVEVTRVFDRSTPQTVAKSTQPKHGMTPHHHLASFDSDAIIGRNRNPDVYCTEHSALSTLIVSQPCVALDPPGTGPFVRLYLDEGGILDSPELWLPSPAQFAT